MALPEFTQMPAGRRGLHTHRASLQLLCCASHLASYPQPQPQFPRLEDADLTSSLNNLKRCQENIVWKKNLENCPYSANFFPNLSICRGVIKRLSGG